MDTNDRHAGIPGEAAAGECRWFQERLGSYLDSALQPRQMRRAARHAELCGDCHAAAASLEGLLAEARDCRAIAVGPDFEDAVWRRIGREAALAQAGRDWTGRGWIARAAESFTLGSRLAWAGGAAALLLVAAVTLRGQAPGVSGRTAGEPPVLASQNAPLPVAEPAPSAAPAADPVRTAPAAGAREVAETPAPRASSGAALRPSAPRPVVVGQMYGDGLMLTSNGGAWRRSPAGVARRPAAAARPSGPAVSGESPFSDEQYVLERVEWVSDPDSPERGTFILRRVVSPSSGQGLSF